MKFIDRHEWFLFGLSALVVGLIYRASLHLVREEKIDELGAVRDAVVDGKSEWATLNSVLQDVSQEDPNPFTEPLAWIAIGDLASLELPRRILNMEIDAIEKKHPGTGAAELQISENFYDVLFGWEQLACCMLAAFAGLIHLSCRRHTRRQRRPLHSRTDPIHKATDPCPLFEEIRALLRGQRAHFVEARTDQETWPRASVRTLEAFVETGDLAYAQRCSEREIQNTELDFELNLATERFIQYAIPTIGFIGTVRGMLTALGGATSPDNLPEVAVYIGGAFTSTLIALVLSLLVVISREKVLRDFNRLVVEIRVRLEKLVLDRCAHSRKRLPEHGGAE